MPTAVVMPQMGESITEGTVVRWIRKLGDRVDRDEPLFEISTDKVDAEIPSPVAGVLLDIRVREGETVPVDSVVATIGEPGEHVAGQSEVPVPAAGQTHDQSAALPAESTDQPRRLRSSPLVRRIAKEHGIDVAAVAGTGSAGRVTKHDILAHIERSAGSAGHVQSKTPPPSVSFRPGEQVEIQPLSIVRRKIAEHMVLSRRTSAHVHTVFHVNFTHCERLRARHKAAYEAAGVKLTYMAFITRAVASALGRFPIVNASLDGNNVVYRKDVNIGIAVALETGLIVPVVKGAGSLSLRELCGAIADVADRARAKQLKAEEVHGGTFTITNPGSFGAQFGMPIINQPQVAILGVGTIEKRPVVVDDAIGIRTMAYLTLGFDHRLIDGAVADAFMADVRQGIEGFDPSLM